MDGATAPLDHPVWDKWMPPAGFNCRCAVLESFDEREFYLPDPLPEPDEGWGWNPGKVFDDELVSDRVASNIR